MEATETKKTIPLVKKSASYKIIIPANVERLIRFLCERVWDTEWSGVLFYTPSGNFEDGSLEIRCQDILPMDIGSATYTEFDMSPDVISYMAENPELLDCKMGLIHSHNNMSTFFSGTDTATLQAEGSDRNHFVSLIVNNAGKYTAAITRKVHYKSIVTDITYESFNGTVTLPEREESEGEEIEYFNLDIVFEEANEDPFRRVAERLSGIKKLKEEAKAKYTANSANTAYTSPSTPGTKSPSKPEQPIIHEYPRWGNPNYKQGSLFDDDDYLYKPPYNYPSYTNYGSSIKSAASVVDDEKIEKIICQLITGSVLITKLDKAVRDKLITNIDKRYDARFGKNDEGMSLFEYWAMDFIEFLVWYAIDDPDLDEGEVGELVAKKLMSALAQLPKSKYIDKFIELIAAYVK